MRRDSSLSLAIRSYISLTDLILYCCSTPSRGSRRRILYSRDDAGSDARTGRNSTNWPTLNFELSNSLSNSNGAADRKAAVWIVISCLAKKGSIGSKRLIRRTRSPLHRTFCAQTRIFELASRCAGVKAPKIKGWLSHLLMVRTAIELWPDIEALGLGAAKRIFIFPKIDHEG